MFVGLILCRERPITNRNHISQKTKATKIGGHWQNTSELLDSKTLILSVTEQVTLTLGHLPNSRKFLRNEVYHTIPNPEAHPF